MNIRCFPTCPGVAPASMAWSAVDTDSYDGAPDAGTRAHMIGYGASKADAIEDLQEQLVELEAQL